MMTQAGTKSAIKRTEYAVGSDFCRIFAQNTNRLYWLSFLLTANATKAEECFVSGLEDSIGSNRVFKEWAQSWARRTIIQKAIRLMQPTRKHSEPLSAPVDTGELKTSDSNVPGAAVLGLKTFERFVFVMSVLERYSDQECKTLLGCSRQDIVRARSQALMRMATLEQTPVSGVVFGAGKIFAQGRVVAETA
jgi:DNA-directed RNA polymerase specialized sigma24 family protein